MPCRISHVTEDSDVCFADTAWNGGKVGRGTNHEGCHKVHFRAHLGCVVRELAAVDYLLVMGGNDVSKPANTCLGSSEPLVEIDSEIGMCGRNPGLRIKNSGWNSKSPISHYVTLNMIVTITAAFS